MPIDPPDPDQVYRNYLETCRLLGIKPTPRERAQELIEEWTGKLSSAWPDPPKTH